MPFPNLQTNTTLLTSKSVQRQNSSGIPTSVRWELVNKNGPKLAKHAGCVFNGSIFVHGGLSNIKESKSLSGLYKYDLSKEEWVDLRGGKGDEPTLSNHVMLPCGPEHLIAVGGWTGRKRHFEVLSYNVVKKTWSAEATTGFPGGAGLSSHTAVPLEEKGAFVVHGREGSLRTQRKSGSAWVMRGWPLEGFVYKSTPMHCASRSGHNAVATAHNQLLVLGGRNDKFVEVHKPPVPLRCNYSGVVNRLKSDSQIMQALNKSANSASKTLEQGRREFVAFGGQGAALIYGGLMFSLGPFSQEPMNDFMLVSDSFQLALASSDPDAPPRAGAVGVVDPATGEAYMHGGYSGRTSKVCRELYRLVMD